MKRFWDKVNIKNETECWDWTAYISNSGYGLFWLNNKMISSHRVAYALSINNLDFLNSNVDYHLNNNNFDCVLHKCDNKICCNPNHLFIGNNKDNINDKVNKNRQQHMIGSLNGYAKLTEDDIIKIRKSYVPRKNGGLKSIADMYNISITNVHDIITRKIWKHI